VKVPLPKHLFNEGLVKWQFRFFIAALLILALGILIGNIWIVRTALILWLGVAGLYGFNVIKILSHKAKTLE
jgi:hypothetical protein